MQTKGGVQTSRLTDSIINWLSDSLKRRDVLIAQLTKRITTLEQESKRMADNLAHLNDEVSRLDSNEQREEAEISTLKTQAAGLQAQLDAANAEGNQAEIATATAYLDAINARIEALIGAAPGTTTTTSTASPVIDTTAPATTDGSNG